MVLQLLSCIFNENGYFQVFIAKKWGFETKHCPTSLSFPVVSSPCSYGLYKSINIPLYII